VAASRLMASAQMIARGLASRILVVSTFTLLAPAVRALMPRPLVLTLNGMSVVTKASVMKRLIQATCSKKSVTGAWSGESEVTGSSLPQRPFQEQPHAGRRCRTTLRFRRPFTRDSSIRRSERFPDLSEEVDGEERLREQP
jgi:hypothetical protein